MNVPTIYRWLGGRKNGNNLLFSLLAVLCWASLSPEHRAETFGLLLGGLGAALGVTGVLHVIEDLKTKASSRTTVPYAKGQPIPPGGVS